MKVKIEIDENLQEEEVIIRCKSLNDSIVSLQNYISEQKNGKQCIPLYQGGTEYYVPIDKIYFFETEGRELHAHTRDKLFNTTYKLYELEEILPGYFLRISKSTIVNLDYIYSITRNLTASSIVEFTQSSKKALVSRAYYKVLIESIETRRMRK